MLILALAVECLQLYFTYLIFCLQYIAGVPSGRPELACRSAASLHNYTSVLQNQGKKWKKGKRWTW